MRLDLSVATGERHVEKILFITYLAKCDTDVALEIVPSETKLLRRPHDEESVALVGTLKYEWSIKEMQSLQSS